MDLNIPAKKRKQYLLPLLAAIALIAISINVLIQTRYMKNLVLNGLVSYIVATIILIWALYRLALWILVIGKEWISSTASLTVTENALVNELNFYSSGTIPFEEINETKIVNYKGKSYLLVLLKQPQKFITGKPILKRVLLKRAFKKLGAPVVFANDQIYYDLEKLQTVINSNLNRASE